MNTSATSETARVLVVDDQRDVLEALRLLLKGEGFQVTLAQSPAAALEALKQQDFDAVLADLNYTRDTTSGEEGLDLVKNIQRMDRQPPVVVMTAWATIEVAVEAMRRGARDFIEKPWDNRRLLSVLRNQVALGRALRKTERLAQENALLRTGGDEAFIAESPAMREVVRLIERVAPADAGVLITGEPGTGKGLVARLIHRNSKRAEDSLISVNMGSVPETVFESEMFGHVRGAFTDAKQNRTGRFELADGGSLFLDEVGNIPPGQQAKLLRVLESGEFEPVGSSRTQHADVRVISATNADLREAVSQGGFRKDLYFRLNILEIPLPPLRRRREDILPLAEDALKRLSQRYGRNLTGLVPEAQESLRNYFWPGNVRELQHVIERAVLLGDGDKIRAADLRLDAPAGKQDSLEGMTLDDAERTVIRNALNRCRGNVNQAAEDLGVSRSALYRRIEKHGLLK